jgi:hypothetical protein
MGDQAQLLLLQLLLIQRLLLLQIVLREGLLVGRAVLLYLGHKVNNYSPIRKGKIQDPKQSWSRKLFLLFSFTLSCYLSWKLLPRAQWAQFGSSMRAKGSSIQEANTYQLHGKGLLLLLLLILLLQLLLASLPELQQSLVVGRFHRPHVHIGVRARRRRLQVDDDQLLMREQVRLRPAGNWEESAAVPLVLAPLLLIKTAQPLLTGILL